MNDPNEDWAPRIPGTTKTTQQGPRPPRSRNTLLDSDNPVVARIGEFLYEEPADAPTGMRAMAGIIVGMSIALEDPDVAGEIIEELERLAPGNSTTDFYLQVGRDLINGRD